MDENIIVLKERIKNYIGCAACVLLNEIRSDIINKINEEKTI